MREVVTTTLGQLDQPGTLATVSATPFGEMAIDDFIGIVWVDPMTHAWDIADATGIAHGIDEATAQAAFDQMAPAIDNLRAPGLFNEAKEAAHDTAIARFIALTGRSSVNR
jgi:hypothetical protein